MKRYVSQKEFNGWVKIGSLYLYNSADGSRNLPDISSSAKILKLADEYSQKRTKLDFFPTVNLDGEARYECWDPFVIEYEYVTDFVYEKTATGLFIRTLHKHTGPVPTKDMADAARRKKNSFFDWRGIY